MRFLDSALTIFLTARFVFSPPSAEAGSGFCQAESDQPVLESGLHMGLAETLAGDAIISLEELRTRVSSSSPAWQLYKMALKSERQGRQQEAFSLAVKASRMEPRLFQVHAALAASYLRSGQLDSAEQEIGVALGLNSHYLPAYELKGILLYLRGALTQSVSTLSKVLKSGPSRPAAHYFLGCALRDMGSDSGEHFAVAENLRRRPRRPLRSGDSAPPEGYP